MNLNDQMRQREQKIDAMLGTRLRNDMNDLEITINDFNQDQQAMFQHFVLFLTGQDGLITIDAEATRKWKRDSNRLLRNYLATRMTLREHTYRLLRNYWEADSAENRPEATDFMDPYRAKVKELLVTPEFGFLQDLRNYGVHRSGYPFRLGTVFRQESGATYMQNTIHLDKAELLESDRWSSGAKQYLRSQSEKVDLLTPIERYSLACKKFYEWFHGAVTQYHFKDFQAVEEAHEDYRQWRRDTGTMPPDWYLNGAEPPA